jgi:hypothetical protein
MDLTLFAGKMQGIFKFRNLSLRLVNCHILTGEKSVFALHLKV